MEYFTSLLEEADTIPVVLQVKNTISEALIKADNWGAEARNLVVSVCMCAYNVQCHLCLMLVTVGVFVLNPPLPCTLYYICTVHVAIFYFLAVMTVYVHSPSQECDGHPQYNILKALLEIGRSLPVKLEPIPQLESCYNAAKTWFDRASRAFVKKGSPQSLLEVWRLCTVYDAYVCTLGVIPEY